MWLVDRDLFIFRRIGFDMTPEIISILSDEGNGNATTGDKNTFVQLLIQEFPDDSRNVMID